MGGHQSEAGGVEGRWWPGAGDCTGVVRLRGLEGVVG